MLADPHDAVTGVDLGPVIGDWEFKGDEPVIGGVQVRVYARAWLHTDEDGRMVIKTAVRLVPVGPDEGQA